MRTMWNGLMLLIVLLVLACNQGCGQPPGNETTEQVVVQTSPTPTNPQSVVVTIFNSGTQDSSMGAQYSVTTPFTSTVPSTLVRINGTTEQDGVAVGVDFGVGQCYYNGNTETPDVFTWSECTNNLSPGSSLSFRVNDTITVWSYAHVCSQDSTIEMVLTGETD